MKKSFSSLLLAFVVSSVVAQTSVVPYTSNELTPTGMVYYLPKTTISVEASAVCVISKPGPFYRYAERFFASKDVIAEESTEWTLVNVELNTIAEPNMNSAFEVKPDIKQKAVSNLISLTNKGVIRGVNINGQILNSRRQSYAEPESVDIPTLEFNMNVLTEEALVANSIPKMAELAAKQVYSIRESRMAIINGDVDVMPNGSAMESVLAEMNRMEKDLLELFFGKSVSFSTSRTFTYVPDDDVVQKVLFRMSSLEGLLDFDNIMGEPVYIDIEGTYPVPPAPPVKAPKVLGFAYCVPGSAEIKIYDNDRVMLEQNIKIPQFGYNLHLMPSLTDNQYISIKYNPNTGEIKQISK